MVQWPPIHELPRKHPNVRRRLQRRTARLGAEFSGAARESQDDSSRGNPFSCDFGLKRMAHAAKLTSPPRPKLPRKKPRIGGVRFSVVRPGSRPGVHAAAHFFTVSQVRVVTSTPKTFAMSIMNTGPLGLGT